MITITMTNIIKKELVYNNTVYIVPVIYNK